jgi:lipopolysaccharide transport system permease protein
VSGEAAPTEVVFRATRSWWRLPLREIWEYRDLLGLLVRRDFTAIYKQSVLGPVWFVLQPLATTLVFTLVFGHFARIGTDGMPPVLFYLAGIMLWTYFQGVLNAVATALLDNAAIFGKVYFPRLIVPLSIVVSHLGQLAINLGVFGAFWAYHAWAHTLPTEVDAAMFTLPLVVVQAAAAGLGCGLWLAALTAKYRDLRFALGFLTQIWMFVTPIVYPTALVPEGLRWILAVNPMAGVVNLARHALLGSPLMETSALLGGSAMAALLLVSGLLVFNRVQRAFVDTL